MEFVLFGSLASTRNDSIEPMMIYARYLKRIFDLAVSLFLFILLLPLLILLFVLIFFIQGRPCLFTQERPGYQEKIFKLYKFATMKVQYDEKGNLLPDEDRLTALGKFLRKTSLDELPELVNVIKGEMSLIGPRPLLPEYLPHYSAEQHRRHQVKPGITGLAQIHGRNRLSWEEKFKWDIVYVDHVSFLLDLKIIFLTLFIVLDSKGISAEGHATMQKFSEKK